MSDTNNECCAPEKKPGRLSAIFKKCAMCAGSGAGGLLAGHAGCIITPVVVAAAGLTGATGGLSIIALAFGAAATAGGLYLWNRLRGKQAGKWEKRIVIGSAAVGLAMSAAFHLAGRKDHCHAPEQDNKMPHVTMCGVPNHKTDTTSTYIYGAQK